MASSWSPFPSARLGWASLLGLALVVLALGSFARFHDLGGAPLAEDEYYTTRSIEWVLADGVPAIPGGGYYDRGLLFQYAAAGFAQLFGADAFAYRLPAALCGLLVGAIGFFYARRHGGTAIGLAVAAALLLSSWEIEFARLVRFYTLFQVALLLFLIALDKAYFEARPGWRYVPHAALLLAALAHELAVLLTPLLFLPLLPQMTNAQLREPRRWLGFALVSLVVVLVMVELTIGLPLRGGGGATDRLPEDYQWAARGMGRQFATPLLPFFRLFSEPFLHLAAVWIAAAVLVLAFITARRLGFRRLEVADLLLGLALLAAAFHLFAALVLVLVLAFARYDLWRLAAQPTRRLVLLGATLAVVLAWLAVVAAAPERLLTEQAVARWGMDVTQPGMLGAVLRAAWSTFFGWPDFYRMTLGPFAKELPELGLALVAAVLWFVIAHRHDTWPELLRHPGALVVYWAVATGLFTFTSTTSRYWFPVLPVIYALLAVSLAEAMARWRFAGAKSAGQTAGAVFLLLFAFGPDFHPWHILNVGDDAVRYRTGAFARFDRTWYARRDVRTVAVTLASRHAESPGARIVIDRLPELSYYLNEEHAVYQDRCCKAFANMSREHGTRDMWSGQRLLGTPADVLAYAGAAEELWLVREIDPEHHWTDLVALERGGLVEAGREVLGQDDRLELIRLRPDKPGARREATTDATD